MAKKPVVVIGLGEMGSVFARGLLRLGHPVYPAHRGTNLRKLAKAVPHPKMVLVAVGALLWRRRPDMRFLVRLWASIQERIAVAPPKQLVHEDLPLAWE